MCVHGHDVQGDRQSAVVGMLNAGMLSCSRLWSILRRYRQVKLACVPNNRVDAVHTIATYSMLAKVILICAGKEQLDVEGKDKRYAQANNTPAGIS